MPTPGGAQQANVGLLFHEGERGEILDLAGIEFGLESEVELIEPLVVRQSRELERVAKATALPHADLVLEREVQELPVAHLRLLGSFDESVGALGDVGQTQTFGMGLDAIGDELAHDVCSFRSKRAS